MSKKVFINANLWDGYADSVFKKCAVFVDGDKIAKISYDEKPDVSGYEVIDLNGKYVTPGLVNPTFTFSARVCPARSFRAAAHKNS